MTIGRIDINEKDLPKICGAIIQLEERADAASASGVVLGPGLGIGSSPGGRLTLQTSTPVMTTTQSAKTTIYYTPYNGSTIGIYDGTNFTAMAFSELSAATSDTTKSPAAIGASKVNDWFVWSDSGTLRLGHGPDWTSDTARSVGTALVMVNGIWLNNASITNGPAASRGTYVGTTRSNGSSQLDWIFGDASVNGTAGFFGLWNNYNRVNVSSQTEDTTGSWTYAVANTWRAANASPTMRTTIVRGFDEDSILAIYNVEGFPGAGLIYVGIGVNSTTAFSGQTSAQSLTTNGVIMIGMFTGCPGLGVNFLSAIEALSTTTPGTWYGNASLPGFFQSGLNVMFRA